MYASIFMPRMKSIHIIMWRCRQDVRQILEKEADIITVRLTWSVLRKGFPMRNYQIHSFQNECQEDTRAKLRDGNKTIFLSTRGKNKEQMPRSLVKFLKFVEADLAESEQDFGDELVKQFQDSIREIKASREMGERYMLFEELLKEERQEGLAQGRQENAREYILEFLADKGEVSGELKEALCKVDSEEELKRLFKLAIKAESTEAFQKIVEETVNKLRSKEN